ncbi:MAG: hypothetical protein ACRC92_26835 [Peptostreptococcaceae bacterium]
MLESVQLIKDKFTHSGNELFIRKLIIEYGIGGLVEAFLDTDNEDIIHRYVLNNPKSIDEIDVSVTLMNRIYDTAIKMFKEDVSLEQERFNRFICDVRDNGNLLTKVQDVLSWSLTEVKDGKYDYYDFVDLIHNMQDRFDYIRLIKDIISESNFNLLIDGIVKRFSNLKDIMSLEAIIILIRELHIVSSAYIINSDYASPKEMVERIVDELGYFYSTTGNQSDGMAFIQIYESFCESINSIDALDKKLDGADIKMLDVLKESLEELPNKIIVKVYEDVMDEYRMVTGIQQVDENDNSAFTILVDYNSSFIQRCAAVMKVYNTNQVIPGTLMNDVDKIWYSEPFMQNFYYEPELNLLKHFVSKGIYL